MENINYTPVLHFLQTEIGPAELAKLLNDTLFDYTQYVMRNTELCGAPDEAEAVYWLRQLVKVLQQSTA